MEYKKRTAKSEESTNFVEKGANLLVFKLENSFLSSLFANTIELENTL